MVAIEAPKATNRSGYRVPVVLRTLTIGAGGLTTLTHIRGRAVEVVLAIVGVLICRDIATATPVDNVVALANAFSIGLMPVYILLGPRDLDPWEMWGLLLITLLITRAYLATSDRAGAPRPPRDAPTGPPR